MDDLHRASFARLQLSTKVLLEHHLHRSDRFRFHVAASLALALMVFCGLVGCSTSRPQTLPAQTPVISIAMTQESPVTLPVGAQAQVSATVSNDPANAGVDWVATCGSATTSCGSFSPAHTDSGVAATFIAPPYVPVQKTVTVTALSSTDHSKAATTVVTLFSTVTSVTITQLPPKTAPAGSTITLSAVVAGDPANLGVDWTATCGTVNCTPTGFHSESGGPVKFVIPSPTQSGGLAIVGSIVKFTAYATADHTCSNRPPPVPGALPPFCSATTSFQVTAPPTVTITQPPPAKMLTNATATLIAVVQNDPTNSGVDWFVSCDQTPCGTVTPSHTDSGAPTVFTAPPNVPSSSNPTVTIAAQATAASLAYYQVAVTIVEPISLKIIQNVPNGTIVQGRTASLIATVSNDSGNAGVDWSVTCSNPGNCGTFSPTHTASGSLTTYSAPPNPDSVTITATSTADPTKTDTQAVTVTAAPPSNSLLSGRFVMLLSSSHSQNGSYVLGGAITGAPITGSNTDGAITSATFDLADASGNTGITVPILPPSTYSIDQNGRGQIQLLIGLAGVNAGTRSFGVTGPGSACGSTPQCGSLTLSVVFVTPQHATLSESDSFGTAYGTLDLQDLQSVSGIDPGVYSLSLSGSEKAQPSAGYFVSSAVTVSSTTSYSYITDQSDNGVITNVPFTTVQQGFANGGFSGGNIRLQFVNLGLPTQFNLSLWAIDATHFVVTDVLDSLLGTPPIIVSGHLTLQPSAPTISGTYAFTELGASIAASQPQAVGGILTCGATGTLDVVALNGAALTNQPISATCGAAVNGRGLLSVTGASPSGINQFAAYPTTDQGLYLIELDGGTSGSSGAGTALPQTLAPPLTNAALNGNYVSNFSASTVLGSQAFAGRFAADGVSTLTGLGDVNSFDATAPTPVATPSPGATFAGTYSSSNDGRFPITLTVTPASGQPAPQITNLNMACYLVDANTCMLLGLDVTAPGTGMLLLQNTGL